MIAQTQHKTTHYYTYLLLREGNGVADRQCRSQNYNFDKYNTNLTK